MTDRIRVNGCPGCNQDQPLVPSGEHRRKDGTRRPCLHIEEAVQRHGAGMTVRGAYGYRPAAVRRAHQAHINGCLLYVGSGPFSIWVVLV